MSDTAILVLVALGFVWGFGTARAMDFAERVQQDRENREAIKKAYLRQRQVRLGDEWGNQC